MSKEIFTFNSDLERSGGGVNGFNILVLDAQTKSLCLLTKLHHHLRTTDPFRVTREILDITGQHQLATRHVSSEHERLKHGTSSVQTSSVSSRTRTDYDDIVNIRHLTHSTTNTPMDLNIIPLISLQMCRKNTYVSPHIEPSSWVRTGPMCRYLFA